MRTVHLHLGMNKAGSNTIQRTFQQYQTPELTYPQLGAHNHSKHVCLTFLERPQAGFFSANTPEVRTAESAVAAAELDKALAEAKGDVILSSEYFWVFPGLSRTRFATEWLRERFDRLHGILYLRDPWSFILSAIQQRLKMHPPFEDLAEHYPHYRRRLGHWQSVLPGDDLEVILLHPSALAGGDLLTDFAQRTGVPETWLARHRRPVPGNESLSAEAIAALIRLRRMDGAIGTPGPRFRANTELVKHLPGFGSTRFALNPGLIDATVANFADDVAYAEAALGRPFQRATPKPGLREFESLDALAAFGEGLGPAFAAFQRRTWPTIAPAGETVEAMMVHLIDRLAEAASDGSPAEGMGTEGRGQDQHIHDGPEREGPLRRLRRALGR